MTSIDARIEERTFTRMDESTAEQWQAIAVETATNQPRVAERVLALLRSLAEITDGFAVDQLTHSLQTATRAEEAGADPEMVVACLCHDIGKAVSVSNHPKIAAEILRPYVSRRRLPGHPGAPGLPGPPLLRVPEFGPRRPQPVPGRALVRAGRAVR